MSPAAQHILVQFLARSVNQCTNRKDSGCPFVIQYPLHVIAAYDSRVYSIYFTPSPHTGYIIKQWEKFPDGPWSFLNDQRVVCRVFPEQAWPFSHEISDSSQTRFWLRMPEHRGMHLPRSTASPS